VLVDVVLRKLMKVKFSNAAAVRAGVERGKENE
jgi:hypothetical protein